MKNRYIFPPIDGKYFLWNVSVQPMTDDEVASYPRQQDIIHESLSAAGLDPRIAGYRVIDTDDANRIATVEVSPGFAVDVKCRRGFMYVMQNEDGTEVFRVNSAEPVRFLRYNTDAVFAAVEKLYSTVWKNWADHKEGA